MSELVAEVCKAHVDEHCKACDQADDELWIHPCDIHTEHRWYAGDSDSDTIWWYCDTDDCDAQMTTNKALTPERLREAAATIDAYQGSKGWAGGDLRAEADRLEDEPPFKATEERVLT